jgi:hypothetical protein
VKTLSYFPLMKLFLIEYFSWFLLNTLITFNWICVWASCLLSLNTKRVVSVSFLIDLTLPPPSLPSCRKNSLLVAYHRLIFAVFVNSVGQNDVDLVAK